MEMKDITEEQKKQIMKILSKARWGLLWVTIKFTAGIFLANLTTFIIGFKLLSDSDPDVQIGFRFVSTLINVIFMTTYLNRQMKINSDTVSTEIKKVLNKSE